MIVVAIAGLILVLVLVAAPALQRNARDQGRRTDATALTGSIANYLTNNGKLPADKAGLQLAIDELSLGHYDGDAKDSLDHSTTVTDLQNGDIGVDDYVDIVTTTTDLPQVDTMHIITASKCASLPVYTATDYVKSSTPVDTDTLLPSSHRQYTIVFKLEGEKGRFVCLDA